MRSNLHLMFRCLIEPAFWAGLLLLGIDVAASDYDHGRLATLAMHMEEVPHMPRLDESIGKTAFVLTPKQEGAEPVALREEGRWTCLGFDEAIDAYVVSGVFQVGAWLPVGAIRYLSEDGKWRDSAFGSAQHMALAMVVSPSTRFVAYVGGPNGTDGLFALDVEANTVRRLGPAPAPPPAADAGMANLCRGERFVWGSCWADGLVEFDPGIVWFASDNDLVVSYGRDAARGRAKKRTVRHFHLDAVQTPNGESGGVRP
jgi:hypothetical protein